MIDQQVAQKVGKAIEQKIEKAFDEGYKAAALRFAPELEYWKKAAQDAENRFWSGFIYGAGSLGIVAALGVAIVFFQPRRS